MESNEYQRQSPVTRDLQTNVKEVYLGGIFDQEFEWGKDLFDFTLAMINDHENGWFDDILNDGTILRGDVADSNCDSLDAALAYHDLKTLRGQKPIHGIVGCRCSGASVQVATLARLEEIPQVSFASTSPQLTENRNFPFFSRTTAPANGHGLTGAIVSMLQEFGWDDFTILTSDKTYSINLSTALQKEWETKTGGTNIHSHNIAIDGGLIDHNSAIQALSKVSSDTRVIVLLAHNEHAGQIMQVAKDMEIEGKLRKGRIWFGPPGWATRELTYAPSMLETHEGYLGLVPRSGEGYEKERFLDLFNVYREGQGKQPWNDFPDYSAAYMVDSILSLAMAMTSIPHQERQNGTLVTSKVRELDFTGVSGPVSYTAEGDPKNPAYTIWSWNNTKDANTGWIPVGNVESDSSKQFRTTLNASQLCFGGTCNYIPNGNYPQPREPLPLWVPITLSLVGLILIAVFVLLMDTIRKKKRYKTMRIKIYKEIVKSQKEVQKAKLRERKLMKDRFALQEKPVTWTKSDKTLIEVLPHHGNEYWEVHDRLRESMSDVHISKLWRVQNDSLWSYYSFHKERLAMSGINENEKLLFHGTSTLDPCVIYNDEQDGFMMQLASKGSWGRGIYFANDAHYSDKFAYKPPRSDPSSTDSLEENASGTDDDREMTSAKKGEREIFLARLLAGDEVFMDKHRSDELKRECRQLTTPPFKDSSNTQRYSCVTGESRRSRDDPMTKIWIVYENGRAYPEYIIRYYRGERDPTRTPYASKDECFQRIPQSRTVNDEIVWQYRRSRGWKEYNPSHQKSLEKTYQQYHTNPGTFDKTTKVWIETPRWKYEVDIEAMIQTNIGHGDQPQRDVRRIDLGDVESQNESE